MAEVPSLRERLRAGGPLVGTFLQAPTAVTAELVAGLGFDFTCVEAEHSAIGVETMQSLVAASLLGGAPALVRVRQNGPAEIGAALDAGAAGVIVPRVDSADEAAAAVAAGRYPPAGRRGVGPGRASGYGRTIPAYLAAANDQIAVGVQIESAAAVEQASSIAAVPGLDLLFVGPGDLAVSLGVPRRPGAAGGDRHGAGGRARRRGRKRDLGADGRAGAHVAWARRRARRPRLGPRVPGRVGRARARGGAVIAAGAGASWATRP